MIKDKNQNDSIFSRENDFALVMASICVAKRLSNDPLSNQIVVQAIEKAAFLSESAFVDTVRSLVEEEDMYNREEDQSEEESNAYSIDEEIIDEKLLQDDEEDESDNEAEDKDDADYETKEENLLDLEDSTEDK